MRRKRDGDKCKNSHPVLGGYGLDGGPWREKGHPNQPKIEPKRFSKIGVISKDMLISSYFGIQPSNRYDNCYVELVILFFTSNSINTMLLFLLFSYLFIEECDSYSWSFYVVFVKLNSKKLVSSINAMAHPLKPFY